MKKRDLVVGLIATSVIMGLYELAAYINDVEAAEHLINVCSTFITLMLAMWVCEDSKTNDKVCRPYDYGLFVFIYWIPYVPYYFIKTRGLKGFLYLMVLVVLYDLGLLLQLGYYFSS